MTDQDFPSERQRSPAYPYLNLAEAIDMSKGFYELHKNGKVPITIALKEMGYSPTSGSATRIIASLTQYDLFDTEGSRDKRKIWLTSTAMAIIRENPHDPSAALRAIRQAALTPNMHKWAFEHYSLGSEELPKDNVIVYDLETEMGFSEKAAEAFVKEFKETYDFAQLAIPDDRREQPPAIREPQTVPLEPNLELGDLFSEPPKSRATGAQSPNSVQTYNSDSREFSTSLTRGKVARLVIPADMNQKDYQILDKWLELLREAELYDDTVDD